MKLWWLAFAGALGLVGRAGAISPDLAVRAGRRRLGQQHARSPGRSTSSATIGGSASPRAACSCRRPSCWSTRSGARRSTASPRRCRWSPRPRPPCTRSFISDGPWFFYWNLPYPNTFLPCGRRFRSPLYWDAVDIISFLGIAHRILVRRHDPRSRHPSRPRDPAHPPGRPIPVGELHRPLARPALRHHRARLARLGAALAALVAGLPHRRAARRDPGGVSADRRRRDVRRLGGARLARHAAAGGLRARR